VGGDSDERYGRLSTAELTATLYFPTCSIKHIISAESLFQDQDCPSHRRSEQSSVPHLDLDAVE